MLKIISAATYNPFRSCYDSSEGRTADSLHGVGTYTAGLLFYKCTTVWRQGQVMLWPEFAFTAGRNTDGLC